MIGIRDDFCPRSDCLWTRENELTNTIIAFLQSLLMNGKVTKTSCLNTQVLTTQRLSTSVHFIQIFNLELHNLLPLRSRGKTHFSVSLNGNLLHDNSISTSNWVDAKLVYPCIFIIKDDNQNVCGLLKTKWTLID